MYRFVVALLLLIIFITAHTQTAQTEILKFDNQSWRVTAQSAEVTSHLGRNALALQGGRLWADGIGFSDGVISFDVSYQQEQVFIGAGWRAQNDSRFEEMYFRGHLNNKPDALQYTPVENELSAWQIFSDENAIAPVSQTFDAWNKVKIVVEGDRADIYFNSDQPVLHVPDLKTNNTVGDVVLRHSGRAAGPAYFSNIVIRSLRDDERIIGTAKDSPSTPHGLISKWQVSSPFKESLVSDTLLLDGRETNGLSWGSVKVETNGIANLAKLARPQREVNTVFVRLKIKSNKPQMKEIRFGYSDRIRIYLNGKRVFYGDAGWRARDYRFLGTVGFFDSAGLDLNEGDNTLLVAISETFGGWAWAGAIEDQSEMSISN